MSQQLDSMSSQPWRFSHILSQPSPITHDNVSVKGINFSASTPNGIYTKDAMKLLESSQIKQIHGAQNQLSWQTTRQEPILLESRHNRINKSLQRIIYPEYKFIKEKGHEYQTGHNEFSFLPHLKTKKEYHFDKLIHLNTPQPIPETRPLLFLNRQPRYDWTKFVRVKNQVDRLQPTELSDPFALRESIRSIGTERGPEIRPDITVLLPPERGGMGSPDTRTEILQRMFNVTTGDGLSQDNEHMMSTDELSKSLPINQSDDNPKAFLKPPHISNNINAADIEQSIHATEIPKKEHILTTNTNNEKDMKDISAHLNHLLKELSTLPFDAESMTELTKVQTKHISQLEDRLKEASSRKTPLTTLFSTRPKPSEQLQEKEPEVFVAIADSLGGRVERLQFHTKPSQQSTDALTVTLGVQVNYADIEKEMFEDDPIQDKLGKKVVPMKLSQLKQDTHTINNTMMENPNISSIVKTADISFVKKDDVDDINETNPKYIALPPQLGLPDPWPYGEITLDMDVPGPKSDTKQMIKDRYFYTKRTIPQLILPELNCHELIQIDSIKMTTSASDSDSVETASQLSRSSLDDKDNFYATVKRTASTLLHRRCPSLSTTTCSLSSGLSACRGGRRYAKIIERRLHHYGDVCCPTRQKKIYDAKKNISRYLSLDYSHSNIEDIRRHVMTVSCRSGNTTRHCRGGHSRQANQRSHIINPLTLKEQTLHLKDHQSVPISSDIQQNIIVKKVMTPVPIQENDVFKPANVVVMTQTDLSEESTSAHSSELTELLIDPKDIDCCLPVSLRHTNKFKDTSNQPKHTIVYGGNRRHTDLEVDSMTPEHSLLNGIKNNKTIRHYSAYKGNLNEHHSFLRKQSGHAGGKQFLTNTHNRIIETPSYYSRHLNNHAHLSLSQQQYDKHYPITQRMGHKFTSACLLPSSIIQR